MSNSKALSVCNLEVTVMTCQRLSMKLNYQTGKPKDLSNLSLSSRFKSRQLNLSSRYVVLKVVIFSLPSVLLQTLLDGPVGE